MWVLPFADAAAAAAVSRRYSSAAAAFGGGAPRQRHPPPAAQREEGQYYEGAYISGQHYAPYPKDNHGGHRPNYAGRDAHISTLLYVAIF